MCWFCNPLCGRCIPPKIKIVACSSCGESVAILKDEWVGGKRICKQCGSPIPANAIPAVHCKTTRLRCAWPCGKATVKDGRRSPDKTLIGAKCPHNTSVIGFDKGAGLEWNDSSGDAYASLEESFFERESPDSSTIFASSIAPHSARILSSDLLAGTSTKVRPAHSAL